MLEFALAYFGNIKCVVTVLACGTGLAFVVIGAVGLSDSDDDIKKVAKRLFPLAVTFALLAGLPSIDDLWKVRIGLIKYGLASPDNVQKGTEEIARIGKKLECKYLGGCDEKK